MGKFTEFKLMLKSLPLGEHQFSYHLGKEFFQHMENEDVRDSDVTVTLDVNHRAEGYVMRFRVNGVLTLLCDRCLDELPVDIDTSYDLTVKYGDDYDDSVDSLLVIPQTDNYLNVAYLIYDTVVLAIPPRHVHPQGKCNRAMSALYKKHSRGSGEDAELEEQLLDEMDDMDTSEPLDE